MKRYQVEVMLNHSRTWEAVYHTDSLPVAKRYAVSLRNPREIQATRVVDQRTEQPVYVDPPAAKPMG